MYSFICIFNNKIMKLKEILLLQLKLKSQSKNLKTKATENRVTEKCSEETIPQRDELNSRACCYSSNTLETIYYLFAKRNRHRIRKCWVWNGKHALRMDHTCTWTQYTEVFIIILENSDMNYECFSYCDKSQT